MGRGTWVRTPGWGREAPDRAFHVGGRVPERSGRHRERSPRRPGGARARSGGMTAGSMAGDAVAPMKAARRSRRRRLSNLQSAIRTVRQATERQPNEARTVRELFARSCCRERLGNTVTEVIRRARSTRSGASPAFRVRMRGVCTARRKSAWQIAKRAAWESNCDHEQRVRDPKPRCANH